jgi:hypothetical protein
MRKRKPFQRDRELRLARFRDQSRARKRPRKTRRGAGAISVATPGVVAPRKFNLTEFCAEVVFFIRSVEREVLVLSRPVTLNFRETEAFSAEATVLLFAEVDRIVSLSSLAKPLTIIDPRRRRPREVLKQIGMHEITGDRCDVVPAREDVVYWKATKGVDQSGQQLSVIEVVAERVHREYENSLELGVVWRGVSEAVANTVDHAYKQPRSGGGAPCSSAKWWMFTQVREGRFSAAVCDLGCGYKATINETIPERVISALAATFVGASQDAQAIHTAMEYGRSGTREANRGRGSRDAMSVLEQHREGKLMIISNGGWMLYSFLDGAEVERRSGSLAKSIRGTIVWWTLPLRARPESGEPS